MNEIHNMLNRLKTLTVKSANGTYTDDLERSAMQQEADELLHEIDRIAKSTNYNTIHMLDGNIGSSNCACGMHGSGSIGSSSGSGSSSQSGLDGLIVGGAEVDLSQHMEEIEGSALKISYESIRELIDGHTHCFMYLDFIDHNTGATITASRNDGVGTLLTYDPPTVDGVVLALRALLSHYNGLSSAVYESDGDIYIRLDDENLSASALRVVSSVGNNITTAPSNAVTVSTTVVQDIQTQRISLETLGFSVGDSIIIDGTTYTWVTNDSDPAPAGAVKIVSTNLNDRLDPTAFLYQLNYVHNAEISFGYTQQPYLYYNSSASSGEGEVNYPSKGGVIRLHIGDENETYNKLCVPIFNMRHEALGLEGFRIDTQSNAMGSLDELEWAVNHVSSCRAIYGAIQNRLEYTHNVLSNTTENLSEARSVIRDTDMASKMMDYTKTNILVQGASSMLAQANQLPQAALSFLS